jgi:hypothetical protein
VRDQQKALLPKLPGNFQQAAAEDVTIKGLGAAMAVGGYNPHKRRASLCASRRFLSPFPLTVSSPPFPLGSPLHERTLRGYM